MREMRDSRVLMALRRVVRLAITVGLGWLVMGFGFGFGDGG